ncbi:hypothetical protein O9K51_06864 [Purpureocillium lavendulum]|uniref:Uncharacterized protein n=1 Tax=Purpureocillium lavendulum TaxID=1247861 RepID=A0AB34FPI6_9HYPO|nr:hypothetical protein O9K51_06864 [Purpureocillium lavendulum]
MKLEHLACLCDCYPDSVDEHDYCIFPASVVDDIYNVSDVELHYYDNDPAHSTVLSIEDYLLPFTFPVQQWLEQNHLLYCHYPHCPHCITSYGYKEQLGVVGAKLYPCQRDEELPRKVGRALRELFSCAVSFFDLDLRPEWMAFFSNWLALDKPRDGNLEYDIHKRSFRKHEQQANSFHLWDSRYYRH